MSDSLMRRALSLQEAGRFQDAAELLQEIARANPSHFAALYSLGVVCLQTGQLEQAQSTLRKAISLNPRFANAWYARGASLLRLRRCEEALASLDQALTLQPDFAQALAERAISLMALSREREALEAIDRALALRPDRADDWNIRGNVLFTMLRFEEALASFDRALSIKPDLADALVNRATSLIKLDRLDAALGAFDAALAVSPDHAIGWNNRGNALTAMKRLEEAAASYERALTIQPDFEAAAVNRGQALLGLRRATRCPSPFVRHLFDEVSLQYEDVMERLSYRAHLHLRELAARVLPRSAGGLRILDLGCGTGLAGDAFKDLAAGGRLDGIDLSERMIEAARKRGIYDELIPGELESALATLSSRYDLVIAADTIVYLGDLVCALGGVSRCLMSGGFFLFSVEKKEGEGWEQTPASRFRHSEGYLRAEAARAGLEFADLIECTLRRESKEPVIGLVVALRNPARS